MKFLTIISTCFMCLCSFLLTPSTVQAASFQYGRITEESTLLYRTATSSEDMSNIYFELTPTYFVKILSSENSFYKVCYNGVNGYVLQNKITPVYQTPTTPFPEGITFETNGSASAVILSIPSVDGDYIGLIPPNTTLQYLGKLCGDEGIKGLGSEWLFVTYTSQQGILKGYIYALLTENLTEIPENTEEVALSPVSGGVISPELLNVNNLLLIAGLSIGALFLILILFAPMRKNKKGKVQPTNQLPYQPQEKIDNDNFDF